MSMGMCNSGLLLIDIHASSRQSWKSRAPLTIEVELVDFEAMIFCYI